MFNNKNNEYLNSAAAKGIELTQFFLSASLAGVEKFTKLQLHASKQLIDDTSSAFKDISSATNPTDVINSVNQLATQTVAQNMCNCRAIYEMVNETQSNIEKMIESHLHNTQQTVSDAIDANSPV